MSFRARIALVAAGAVALAVVAASGVVYLVVRTSSTRAWTRPCGSSMERIQHAPADTTSRRARPSWESVGGYPQAVRRDGVTTDAADQNLTLPVNEHVLRVARGTDDTFFANATRRKTISGWSRFPTSRASP